MRAASPTNRSTPALNTTITAISRRFIFFALPGPWPRTSFESSCYGRGLKLVKLITFDVTGARFPMHLRALARMTSPAILEIQIAAKGSLAVMASSAGVVSAGEVFEGPRRADLSFLRQARRVVMTIRAAETLSPAVLRVTEGESKRGRVG